MADGALFYYRSDFVYDDAALEKFLNEKLVTLFGEVKSGVANLESVTHEPIDALFKEICVRHGIKMKEIGLPARVALTGGTAAPGLFDVIEVLGKEESVRRMERAIDHVKELLAKK
jgi:glutamyl-tRNA synthetase